jgi:hypothetical protein
LNKAFPDGHCYLVGSSLVRADYHDVDVRLILEDAVYDRLFQNESGYTNPLWSLICTTVSAWLSQQSGLPRIDFQIQRQTRANEDFPMREGHTRNALGIFVDYPGHRPTSYALPHACRPPPSRHQEARSCPPRRA